MITSEFHHSVLLDRIGPAGLDVAIKASHAQCAALADRMQVPVVHALICRFHLVREDRDHVAARGHLLARITQTCVVSMEDFETDVEERFQVRFVPAGEETDLIDPEADDDLPYDGNTIDLGEAAAQQLGLAIDPYPRMPGAELPEEKEATNEPPPHPFAALGSLRKLN